MRYSATPESVASRKEERKLLAASPRVGFLLRALGGGGICHWPLRSSRRSKLMKDSGSKLPYRRSIWESRDSYAWKGGPLSSEEVEAIASLQNVESAKKRIPPISVSGLLKIAKILEQFPEPEDVTPKSFEHSIREMTNVPGAGIKTVIAFLAVNKNGKYPPLDRKVITALELQGYLSQDDGALLNGNTRSEISSIYINKVLPIWIDRITNSNPQDVDEEWGRIAETEKN